MCAHACINIYIYTYKYTGNNIIKLKKTTRISASTALHKARAASKRIASRSFPLAWRPEFTTTQQMFQHFRYRYFGYRYRCFRYFCYSYIRYMQIFQIWIQILQIFQVQLQLYQLYVDILDIDIAILDIAILDIAIAILDICEI